ncbi:hypothetical protein B0J13DRAFT_562739 [Dactylonectria estremocensis]|uniref:Uncharacterized protein n=1 Tax=Dactylonectria estremocensis TaxID=1079267 RepID=A0A9P9E668_9HYPO|nr:hypothetical protein B0J13DRAFT_562739 [Dactylonectria estremocensis]
MQVMVFLSSLFAPEPNPCNPQGRRARRAQLTRCAPSVTAPHTHAQSQRGLSCLKSSSVWIVELQSVRPDLATPGCRSQFGRRKRVGFSFFSVDSDGVFFMGEPWVRRTTEVGRGRYSLPRIQKRVWNAAKGVAGTWTSRVKHGDYASLFSQARFWLETVIKSPSLCLLLLLLLLLVGSWLLPLIELRLDLSHPQPTHRDILAQQTHGLWLGRLRQQRDEETLGY